MEAFQGEEPFSQGQTHKVSSFRCKVFDPGLRMAFQV